MKREYSAFDYCKGNAAVGETLFLWLPVLGNSLQMTMNGMVSPDSKAVKTVKLKGI